MQQYLIASGRAKADFVGEVSIINLLNFENQRGQKMILSIFNFLYDADWSWLMLIDAD